MGDFGGLEWLVIILLVLILFGAKKIPELARGIGQGISEFRRATGDIRDEIERGGNDYDRDRYNQQPRYDNSNANNNNNVNAAAPNVQNSNAATPENTENTENKSANSNATSNTDSKN